MRSMMAFLFGLLRGSRGAGPSHAHGGHSEDVPPHYSPSPVVHHSPVAPPQPDEPTYHYDDQDHPGFRSFFYGESLHHALSSFLDIFYSQPSFHTTPSMPLVSPFEPQSSYPIQPAFQQPPLHQPPMPLESSFAPQSQYLIQPVFQQPPPKQPPSPSSHLSPFLYILSLLSRFLALPFLTRRIAFTLAPRCLIVCRCFTSRATPMSSASGQLCVIPRRSSSLLLPQFFTISTYSPR